MLGLAAYNPFIVKLMSDLEEYSSSCEGIEYYYTGENFKYDVQDLIFKANDCYYPIEQKWNARWFPPKALKNCTGIEGIDCEDISHMVMCLADLYNISCNYYITLSTYEGGHQGINCNVDGYLWEVY
jgi:hypothetical protein